MSCAIPSAIALAAALCAAVPAQVPTLDRIEPAVTSDGRVTFRLRAAEARSVTVSVRGPGSKVPVEPPPRLPLTKDADGVWSVTVGPLEPAWYVYSFYVDGMRIPDPGNPLTGASYYPATSLFDVRGPAPRVDEVQDVPHGTVHHHTYQSHALARARDLVVYTPPGYEGSRTRYPVLYLLHGTSSTEKTWTREGMAQVILDNLIAGRQAVPMIVVMPNGHAVLPPPADAAGAEETRVYRARNHAAFESDLKEVVPFVERLYRVRPEPDMHAIAGLSMGGRQALAIGFTWPQYFRWIAGFSPSFENEDQLRTLVPRGSAARQLRLVWLACGTEDTPERVASTRTLDALVKQAAIRHDLRIERGDHTFTFWRKNLADLAPLLFRR